MFLLYISKTMIVNVLFYLTINLVYMQVPLSNKFDLNDTVTVKFSKSHNKLLTLNKISDIIIKLYLNNACVAQLAEQFTRNEQVAGSNPAASSRLSLDATRVRARFIIAFPRGFSGYLFCSVNPAASRRTQITHLILWGVISFAPAPKRISILSMFPTPAVSKSRTAGFLYLKLFCPRADSGYLFCNQSPRRNKRYDACSDFL